MERNQFIVVVFLLCLILGCVAGLVIAEVWGGR